MISRPPPNSWLHSSTHFLYLENKQEVSGYRPRENRLEQKEPLLPVSDSYLFKYRRARVSFPVVGNRGSPVEGM